MAGSDFGGVKGPDEAKIKELLESRSYSLDVTTGQRQYGGPPSDYEGPEPKDGCEVYCGRLPPDVYEDTIVPLFEQFGKIWGLRLMMEPRRGITKGFCFVTYCESKDAQEAASKLNGYQITPGRKLIVNISTPNKRLFVGNIPKNKDKDEILEEFGKLSDGLVEVIIYGQADDQKKKNRGFAFLDYDCHKNASDAKRRLGSGKYRVWNCDILVDWADPLDEPDEDTMSKVRVLYVRNITSDVTEDLLRDSFSEYGDIERVKKIKDYGFIHFSTREQAQQAMDALNRTKIGKNNIEVLWAKPPSDVTQKKKEQRRRDMDMLRQGAFEANRYPMNVGRYDSHPLSGRVPLRSSPVRGMVPGRGYDYEYDYYGYSNYAGGYGGPMDSFYDDSPGSYGADSSGYISYSDLEFGSPIASGPRPRRMVGRQLGMVRGRPPMSSRFPAMRGLPKNLPPGRGYSYGYPTQSDSFYGQGSPPF